LAEEAEGRRLNGAAHRRGPLVRALLAGFLLAVASTTAGCVPQRPDEGGWRHDARQAVGDVQSQLQTVRLVLTLEQGDGMLGESEVVIVTQSEEAAGMSTSAFTGQQPPDAEQDRYAVVSAELEDGTSLLADVRIAVVDDESTAYAGLKRRIDTQLSRLHDLDDNLTRPSGSS
jgi:hypothetical protein